MTNAFPEECPDCGTESAESSSMGVWCDPCDEWFEPEPAEAAEPEAGQ
jgi:ribosomal protein L37AE/L43A